MNIPSMYSAQTTKNIRYINLILDVEKHEDAPIFQSVKKSEKGWYESLKHSREIIGLISSISVRNDKLINKAGIEIEIERLSISLIAKDENWDIAQLYMNFNIKSSFARSIVCSLMWFDNLVDKPIKFSLWRSKDTGQANLTMYDIKTNERISRADDYNLSDLRKQMVKKVTVNKKEQNDTSELDDYMKTLITDELSKLPMNQFPEVFEHQHKEDERSKNEAILDEVLADNPTDDDLPF